jgi:hypothetical protein
VAQPKKEIRMSHSLSYQPHADSPLFVVFYDSDFGAMDMELPKHLVREAAGERVKIPLPFELVKQIIAQHIRSANIMALEDMTDDDLIELAIRRRKRKGRP